MTNALNSQNQDYLVSRVNRTRAQARSTYNRLSRWYDALAASEHVLIDRGLRLLAIRSGETVLDIGFGTARSTLALSRQTGVSGVVAGIDHSMGMIKMAVAKLVHMQLYDRPFLHLGDAVALPYASAFFNAIFSSFTLELFDTPEVPSVLSECLRVLKPGGRMCVVSLSKPAHSNLILDLYEWFHRKLPVLVDCRPIPVKLWLNDAGFRVHAASNYAMWGLPVEIVLAFKD